MIPRLQRTRDTNERVKTALQYFRTAPPERVREMYDAFRDIAFGLGDAADERGCRRIAMRILRAPAPTNTRKQFKWTDAETAILRAEVAKGTTYAVIGAMINRSEPAARHRAKKLGIQKRHHSVWTAEEKAQAHVMYDQCVKRSIIAKRFGRTESSVNHLAIRDGWVSPIEKKVITREDRARARCLRLRGKAWPAIAEELGFSLSGIYRSCRKKR